MNCLFFDLDGTLADTAEDLRQAVNVLRTSRGLTELAPDVFRTFIGNGSRLQIARSFADRPGWDVDELLDRYLEIYLDHVCERTRLYPGAADGLRQLKQAGFSLNLFSNKPQEPCEKILQHLGIADCFDRIIGAGDAYPLKPDPAALNDVLTRSGADRKRSAIFGDHYTDLEAGRRAGIRRVLALYGYGNPREEVPDATAAAFSDFTDWAFRVL